LIVEALQPNPGGMNNFEAARATARVTFLVSLNTEVNEITTNLHVTIVLETNLQLGKRQLRQCPHLQFLARPHPRRN